MRFISLSRNKGINLKSEKSGDNLLMQRYRSYFEKNYTSTKKQHKFLVTLCIYKFLR